MDTKRTTIPAAEEILGGYFPVLDHGFVSLVDYMGSDDAVERAARVSYGAGTRKVSATRGLVRYLRRHRHTTPSEMVELKFHCAMPMFVARQWIRHRTACLASGTEVYFDLPSGIDTRGNQLYKLRIEEIWERFQPTRNASRPDEQENPYFRRDRVRGMRLRQMNEDTTELRHTRVVDVFRNGPKPVFRMVLADGKSIEATADHQFVFADGWSTPAKAAGLREVNGKAVWEEGEYHVQVNGTTQRRPALCHGSMAGRELDFVQRLGGPPVRTEWVPKPRIAWNRFETARLVRVERFEFVGVRETYDLEVEGPYHNFVANGIITHNSVNELSARYSLMPLLFYTPAQDQFALQSRSNKQGREGDAPEAVYREAVERWQRLREDAGGAYGWMLEQDVAREIARIDLPVSTYTQWYWKVDLHNLLHFLSLRVDPRAQWEIREFARVIAGMVKRVAPLSYEAWVDYDLESRPLTRTERHVLARLVEADGQGLRARDGAEIGVEQLKAAGLSGREVVELMEKIGEPERPDFELDLGRMVDAATMEATMYEAVPGGFE